MFNTTGTNQWVGYAFRMVIIVLALIFAFFPVLWVISASFNEVGTLNTQSLIPQKAGLGNYDLLLNSDIHPFGRWMFNSVFVAALTSFLSVIISAMGAYAFSRFRFYGRKRLMLTVFLVQVFPSSLSIVATFLLIEEIGNHIDLEAFGIPIGFGLNTYGGLILVYLGGALGINTWIKPP